MGSLKQTFSGLFCFFICSLQEVGSRLLKADHG